MSIANKLQTIAENEQKVYKKGYENGYATGNIDGFNSAPPNYLPCVTTLKIADLNLLGKKEVVLNIPLVKNYANMLQQSVINEMVEHITINGSKDGEIRDMAYLCSSSGDKTLKHITLNCDFSKATKMGRAFYLLQALEIIDGTPLDFSSIQASSYISNIFYCCAALKDFRVVPLSLNVDISINYSSELSSETIQSLIDGLADLTGGTAQTVSWHSTVLSKLTESQIAQILGKNWIFN